jgi:NADH dehydrogenase
MVEQRLMDSGMTYTILRPSYFMEAWLSPVTGFDFPNAKAQIRGDGTRPVSYISYHDVAKFAVKCLDHPGAVNTILELGGPEMVSPLDAVRVFERVGGSAFEIETVPADSLLLQMREAPDPMQQSFAGLMACVAQGDPIDMTETAIRFGVDLKSVREYAREVMSAN